MFLNTRGPIHEEWAYLFYEKKMRVSLKKHRERFWPESGDWMNVNGKECDIVELLRLLLNCLKYVIQEGTETILKTIKFNTSVTLHTTSQMISGTLMFACSIFKNISMFSNLFPPTQMLSILPGGPWMYFVPFWSAVQYYQPTPLRTPVYGLHICSFSTYLTFFSEHENQAPSYSY